MTKNINKNLINAKDTPWDAVQMGSVVCTVVTKVMIFLLVLIKTQSIN